MKNNKILIIIVIILLNILVVFMASQAFLEKESEYDIKIKEARSLAKRELCQRSIMAYDEALAMTDSLALRIEMIDVFDKALEIGEITKPYTLYSRVEEMVELYPKDAKAYEEACEFFIQYDQYETCATLLMTAEDRHVKSDKLTKILNDVRYLHKVSHTMYSDISSLFNGSYLAKTDDAYSVLDAELIGLGAGTYSFASGFSEGLAFVRVGSVGSEYRSFLINKAGIRQSYFDGVTESSGVGRGIDKAGKEILLLSGKTGDVYKYYDVNGKVLFGEYLFAGRFRNNVAAVMEEEGKWKLINAQGKPIVDTVFEDVILNEFDDCAAKGIVFAKTNGKYNMYDTKGKKIGEFSCDDARPFIEDYAAFKSGELWGFVDSKGKIIIEPQYEDAKSFSKGLAGVQLNGVWNFIDKDNKVMIEGNYEEAGYFGANGICTVKMNGRWSVLYMYYISD